ncbi:MAG TPA: ABC transporter permease [Cyclobacteriaceae bacterium]|jgi:putative ABC transport system permease protein|nr:ABC transporter permease [Cyclobacteriaceae bacterium]
MFKNLFKIALRSLYKDKTYSAINIFGLTIGITCSLFLLLYILDELSFDRYHKNADNIYRIISNIKEPDNAFTWASTQTPLADELDDNYPEVENAVRFIGINRTIYKIGDKQFPEEKFYLTDSTVFDMFSYHFIAGDPSTALDNSFSIVMTETIAKKYFASAQQALGESIQNQQGETFKVTGIIEDVPNNSHFRFDALISKNTRPNLQSNWGGFGVFTYIQLPSNYDLTKMQVSLDKIIAEKVNPIFERMGIKVKYELQPITKIHLYSKIDDEAESGGDIAYIYIFSAVGIFMLVIACINYMNLATARSANRAKEVGIRKVMGSEKKLLIYQFLSESIVVALIALVLSLAMIFGLLPYFNMLSAKTLSFNYIFQPVVIWSLIAIVVFTGLIGGSYPAFYLSSFNPVNVLKGKLSSKGGSVFFRKSLVIVQFALGIFMLISTLIVFDQLKFLRTKDLGFDKEKLMRLELSGRDQFGKAPVLLEALKKRPEVVSAGMANASPGQGIGKNIFQVEDSEGKMVERGVDLYFADYDFVKTMRMTIVQGRDFSHEIESDSLYGVLVNESMVKRMGWKDPIGRRFTAGQQNQFEKRVVGVVKDYHQRSLYEPIEPLIIILGQQNNYVFVRTTPGDIGKTLSSVESAWKEVYPNDPFGYTFVNQDLDSQYRADQKRSQVFTVFSFLTVFIACLGLLGLAAFTTEQRTKEIGVRKVIGASVNSLVVLVSKEFVVLVSLGTILASIAALYFTNHWLQNFSYRIEVTNEWSTFLFSALLAFMITLLTVGFHVVRAAVMNPVKSLRDD